MNGGGPLDLVDCGLGFTKEKERIAQSLPQSSLHERLLGKALLDVRNCRHESASERHVLAEPAGLAERPSCGKDPVLDKFEHRPRLGFLRQGDDLGSTFRCRGR